MAIGDRTESALWGLGQLASPYLTLDRIRAAALLLFLGLWGIYAYAISNPGLRDRFDNLKGTDFVLWYTLGDFGRTGDVADLYRWPEKLEERQFAIVPESKGDFFVCLYPPQMTALFAPFSRLPYLHALLIWSVIGVGVYATCIIEVVRTCPNLRPFAGTVAICAAAYPAFFEQVGHGQCAIVSLACVTVAYLALKIAPTGSCRGGDRNIDIQADVGCDADRAFRAARMSLPAAQLVVQTQRSPKSCRLLCFGGRMVVLAGVTIGAGLQYGIAALVYGFDVMANYVRTLLTLGEAVQEQTPKLYNMHRLRAFWTLLIPEPTIARGLYLISAVGVLFLAWRAWRRNTDVGLKFAVAALGDGPHQPAFVRL